MDMLYTCLVCGETKTESANNGVTVTNVKFHYVETGYSVTEPIYELIYSKNDLTKYYETNKENYDLESNKYGTGFLDICDLYTD
jgi:hypothetical protein